MRWVGVLDFPEEQGPGAPSIASLPHAMGGVLISGERAGCPIHASLPHAMGGVLVFPEGAGPGAPSIASLPHAMGGVLVFCRRSRGRVPHPSRLCLMRWVGFSAVRREQGPSGP